MRLKAAQKASEGVKGKGQNVAIHKAFNKMIGLSFFCISKYFDKLIAVKYLY